MATQKMKGGTTNLGDLLNEKFAEAEAKKGEKLTVNEKKRIREAEKIKQDGEELKKVVATTTAKAMCVHCHHISLNVDVSKSTYHCNGCSKFTGTKKAIELYEKEVGKTEATKKQTKKKKVATKEVKTIEKAKTEAKETGQPQVVSVQKKKKRPAKKKVVPITKMPSDQVIFVNPNKIVTCPFIRDKLDGLLERTVDAVGVRTPLVARFNEVGDLELVSGTRRWTAAVKSYAKNPKGTCATVPVFIREYAKKADLYADMIVSNDHQPFSSVDEAALVKRMRDEESMKIADIAKATGKSQVWVRHHVAIADASNELKKLLIEGSMDAKTAYELLKDADSDEDREARLILKFKLNKAVASRKRAPLKKRKKGGVGGTTGVYTPKRIKRMLSELASMFTQFERGGGPAKESNDEWLDFLDIINEVRQAKKDGRLSF